MSDSLTSDGYTQPQSYGDILVLPTICLVKSKTSANALCITCTLRQSRTIKLRYRRQSRIITAFGIIQFQCVLMQQFSPRFARVESSIFPSLTPIHNGFSHKSEAQPLNRSSCFTGEKATSCEIFTTCRAVVSRWPKRTIPRNSRESKTL
jgi:hypothetical protein